jgi:hypothetical protein
VLPSISFFSKSMYESAEFIQNIAALRPSMIVKQIHFDNKQKKPEAMEVINGMVP